MASRTSKPVAEASTCIAVPPRAQAQIAAAVERAQAAQRELESIIQIVADALEVPPGYTIGQQGGGLAFMPGQGSERATGAQ